MGSKQSDSQRNRHSEETDSPPSGAPAESNVDDLFDEYLDAEERGEELDLEGLIARAGSGATELRELIQASAQAQEVGRWHMPPTVPTSSTQLNRPLPVRLGRFELLEHLGSGGLAQVYRARDHKLKRDVAIKLLDHRGELGEHERGLLLNEARSLAPLEHPGIVKLHDALEIEGMLAIVLEYVPGVTLSAVNLQRKVPATATTRSQGAESEAPESKAKNESHVAAAIEILSTYRGRVQLLLDLARAVAYCHDRGVLHRDLKPGNVILRADGSPTIVDFGLAHVAEVFEDKTSQITQSFQGTPEYLAPEQVEEMRTGANPATDQFALGVMLYELLTRTTPFRKDRQTLTLAAVSKAEYEKPRNFDPSIPLDLELICRHCLERRPEDRYPDVEALALDLEAFLEHRPISLSNLSVLKQASLFVRRNKRAVAMTAAVFGLLFGLVLALQVVQAKNSRAELERVANDLNLQDINSPHQFTNSAHKIAALKTEAARRDESTLVRWLGQPLSIVAEKSSYAWSMKLAEILSEKEATAEDLGMQVAWAPWRIALGLDGILNPDSELNRFNRERGTVTLPEGIDLGTVRLFQYFPITIKNAQIPRLFARDHQEALFKGHYRIHCQSSQSKQFLNIEFTIESDWLPKFELSLRPPNVEVFESLQAVPTGSVELAETFYYTEVDGYQTSLDKITKNVQLWSEANIDGGNHHIPSFFISPTPVTWAQIKGLLKNAPTDKLNELDFDREFLATDSTDDDQPATNISWYQAYKIAQYCGLRLPSELELIHARNVGAIAPESIDGFTAHEHNCIPVHHESTHPLSWDEVDKNRDGPIHMWSNQSAIPPDVHPAPNQPIALRFATSAETIGFVPKKIKDR